MLENLENPAQYRQRILKLASVWRRVGRAFRELWGVVVSTLGTLIGIVGMIAALLSVNSPLTLWASIGLLLLITISSLVLFVVSYFRYLRLQRFVYAIKALHIAIHILRNEISRTPQSNGALKTTLPEVLGAFKTAFTILINGPCRACIKVIDLDIQPGQNVPSGENIIAHAYARTFSRDFETQGELVHVEGKTDNPVQHNTAFHFLFTDNRNRCYFCNDLEEEARLGQYENTSMIKYAGGVQQEPGSRKSWSLPYRATMVWPIRRITSQASSGPGIFTGKQDLIGFLAIDTPLKNTLDMDLHFDIGAALADALYVFLDHMIPPGPAQAPAPAAQATNPLATSPK